MKNENKNAENEKSRADSGRRRFLNGLIVAAGTLITMAAGFPVIGYILEPAFRRMKRQWVAVGPANQFPVGETILVSFQNPTANPWAGDAAKTGAWVRRVQNNNFIAFVLNCSHLGCPVRWEASAKMFMCPCHGSVYYEDGSVAAGPAPEALHRFHVRVNNGQVELETRPIPIT